MTISSYMRNLFQSTFYLDTINRIKDFIADDNFVLDIGSGSMPYSYPLKSRAVALDRDKNFINLIEKRKGLYFLNGDAENLPFKDCIFDRVIMTESLEHISDRDKALGEVIRVIANDGELFLTTPNAERAPLDRSYKIGHLIHYEEKELSNFLKRYFDVINIEKRFYWHNLLNLQYIFWDKWLMDKRKLHFYILKIAATVLYNIIYPIEKIFLKGRYNLVAWCKLPKKE